MSDGTFVRSMLGQQSIAHKVSSPQYGFGTGTRDAQDKLFITEEHSKLSLKTRSPGPAVYDKESTLGRNVDHIPTLPQWQFGTSQRFSAPSKEILKFPGPGGSSENPLNVVPAIGMQVTSPMPSQPKWSIGNSTRDGQRKIYLSEKHTATSGVGNNSPGPAGYELQSSVGKQYLSPKESPPSWAFGSNQRFKDPDLERAKKLPGPDYTHPSGVGVQPSSTKRSAPLAGFGTSTRGHMQKIFITPDHEKVNYGKASPGPLSYSLTPGVGKQMLSSKREAPQYGFGSCDRWYTSRMAARHGNTPGPGGYNI